MEETSDDQSDISSTASVVKQKKFTKKAKKCEPKGKKKKQGMYKFKILSKKSFYLFISNVENNSTCFGDPFKKLKNSNQPTMDPAKYIIVGNKVS